MDVNASPYFGSYLADLTGRIAAGLERLPPDVRDRHIAYLAGAQREDGGFPGRVAQSDLYYTSFALRSLMVLGGLHMDIAERAAAFLQGFLQQKTSLIDFLCLILSASMVELVTGNDGLARHREDWRDGAVQVLENLRRPDGGYAKTDEGQSSSTYHSFLVVVAMQLLGRTPPDPERLVQFVLGRRREDGGFVEIGPMKRSGANPTAAAVGLLKILGRVEPDVRLDVAAFLEGMQTGEGGLRANTRIPLADLLSTFSGVWTFVDLGAHDRLNAAAVRQYVWSQQQNGGGFRGATWDDAVDVEYTFYGLGSLGLLADAAETG